MSRLQRIAKAILPKKFADDMEASSRKWHLECHTCGHRRSIWDHGGIRYGASGKSATFGGRCHRGRDASASSPQR